MEPSRRTATDPVHATERELHEQVGYTRCEIDAAAQRLAELQAKRSDLLRQRDVVDQEVAQLRSELEQKLGHWCALDDLSQRHEVVGSFLTKLEAVQSSLTYRLTKRMLRVINRVWWLVSFRWARERREP